MIRRPARAQDDRFFSFPSKKTKEAVSKQISVRMP